MKEYKQRSSAPTTPTSSRKRPAPGSGNKNATPTQRASVGGRANQAAHEMAANAIDDGQDDQESDLKDVKPKRAKHNHGVAAGLNGQNIDLTTGNDEEIQFFEPKMEVKPENDGAFPFGRERRYIGPSFRLFLSQNSASCPLRSIHKLPSNPPQ